MYQSKSIPIPVYPSLQTGNPINDQSVNFIGRLARELLRITDAKTTYYVEKKSAWYDLKSKEEVVNLRLFKKLEQSLNSFGLHGLDSLYSFMIAKDLQSLISVLKKSEKNFEELGKNFFEQIKPLETISNLNAKFYQQVTNKFTKIFPMCTETLMRVGQMQLLRTKICYELNNAAKFDSKQLLQALNTLNRALMTEVNAHYEDPNNPYPDEENPLLYELNPYLECVGLVEPLKKIYVMADKCENVAIFISMLIISQLSKLPSVKLTGLFDLL